MVNLNCSVVDSLLQHRPHPVPVLLPLAGARVQDEAGGEIVVATIASTGGNLRPVSGSEECGVSFPLAWQGLRGAAAGRRKNFRR